MAELMHQFDSKRPIHPERSYFLESVTRWKRLIHTFKGPRPRTALPRQQPMMRRDDCSSRWPNDGDKWRSLLSSTKSTSHPKVEIAPHRKQTTPKED